MVIFLCESLVFWGIELLLWLFFLLDLVFLRLLSLLLCFFSLNMSVFYMRVVSMLLLRWWMVLLLLNYLLIALSLVFILLLVLTISIIFIVFLLSFSSLFDHIFSCHCSIINKVAQQHQHHNHWINMIGLI